MCNRLSVQIIKRLIHKKEVQMIRITYLLLLITSFSFTTFSQVKYTWSGGNGDWQTASNWSPVGVPGATDTVVINNGTITSDQNVTVASIYLNSGTINGAGNFIITDTLIVNFGNLVGTGTTTIASGAVAKFVSSSNKNLSNFIVDGSLTVIGAGPVSITSGGQLINNGTVEIQNNSSFGGAGGSIVNNGNFIRSFQTGTAMVSGLFTNNGSVTVQTGILAINNLTGAGSFNMSTGAVFRINSGTSTLGGNTISGEGTFECISGTLNFSGNDVVVSNATTFRQAGGTIGGSGNLVINGNFIFESGPHGGTGTTTIANGANLNFTTSFSKTITRTFVIDGVLTVVGAGPVSITSGGQLINNGTVEIQNNNNFGNADGTIINNGNFIRTTQTGTAMVSGLFTNNGSVTVQTGILAINNLTGAGSFNMSTGAVFRINSGTSTLGGNTISGEGTFECISGTLNFSGNDVVVSNATTFRQAGGTIGGSGNLVINGNFIFESGTHGGTGTTTIANGANLNFTTSFGKTITRTFVIDGVLTVVGAGTIGITSGGQLINNGTAEIQNNNTFGNAGGPIINNGNFIRTTQTGTVDILSPFTNNGIIEILTGTLSFISSLTNSLQGEIKGVGTLSPGNNFTNDGAVSPGASPGVLRVSGNYPQSSDGVLNIEIGGYELTNRDSLSVTQQAQLNGTLNIIFTNNFTPQIGDVFPFLSYQSRSGEFSQVNFPNNVIGYIQYLSNGAHIVIDSTTSVDEEDFEQLDSEKNKIPTTYELSQNYPNPFNPSTKINYDIPASTLNPFSKGEGTLVQMKVYDVLGNEVATLVNEQKPAGVYEVEFNASQLSSGIYFYKLQAGSFVETKKMILMK